MDFEEFKANMARGAAQSDVWIAEMRAKLSRIEEKAKLLRTRRREEPDAPRDPEQPST
jgi:hypothetical protein